MTAIGQWVRVYAPENMNAEALVRSNPTIASAMRGRLVSLLATLGRLDCQFDIEPWDPEESYGREELGLGSGERALGMRVVVERR